MPARAYGKRSYRKKTTKRSTRRTPKYANLRTLTANTVYPFTRWSTPTTITCDAVSQAIESTFTLNGVYGYNEFTALFDQYKIDAITMYFQLITNPDAIEVTNSNSVVGYCNWYPKLWYVFDGDDAGAGSLDGIREIQGAKFKVLRPNKIISIKIKPNFLSQTYRTELTTGYAPRRGWLDCANANIPHYGFRSCIDCLGLNPNDTYPFKLYIEHKYHLSFKGVS